MESLRRRVEKLERQQVAPGASHSAQFDDDALTIYRGMPYLDATMFPSYDKVQPTEIYARGRELHEKRYGRIMPAHLDPHLKRCTLASAEFEFVFEREPRPETFCGSSTLGRCIVRRLTHSTFANSLQRGSANYRTLIAH